MKTNFLRDKSLSARHPGWRISPWRVWFLVLVVVLILLGQSLFRQGLESPVTTLAVPVLKFNHWLSNSPATFADYLSNQKKLTLENQTLRAERDSLKLKLLVSEAAVSEYQNLRGILGLKTPSSNTTLAKVIAAPGNSLYDVLILDISEQNLKNSVTVNSLATIDNILLGRVVSVEKNLSKVQLFSSAQEKLVVNLGPESIPATINGAGGGNFVTSLPRTLTVAPGDVAVVPTLGSRVVAIVGAVDNNPQNPFQTVYLKSPVNVYTLNWIEINAR